MCGRFTLTIEALEAQLEFELDSIPDQMSPRYNIAPSQPIAVVSSENPRQVAFMRWGLVPFWAKDPGIGLKMINARSETLVDKPAFRQAFKQRRCLILADGFYEWQKNSAGKGFSQPYYFRLKDGKPFAFAGIWESWVSKENETIHSCAIITCAANACVLPVHERMPVILTKDSWSKWLHNSDGLVLSSLLGPIPGEQMTAYPVSRLVNSPSQDSQACVQPAN